MSTLRVSTLANQGGTQSTAIENAINGSAKAWVNFNGTGNVVRASYNVSSITDNGTGDYTVNFTNALTDANYSVVGFSNLEDFTSTSNAYAGICTHKGATRTSSSMRIQSNRMESSSTASTIGPILQDQELICVTIFR